MPGPLLADLTGDGLFDEAQAGALFARSWAKAGGDDVKPVTSRGWSTFCTNRARRAVSEQTAAQWLAWREQVPDTRLARAVMGMNERERSAREAWPRQVASLSAFTGGSPSQVARFLAASRAQYAEAFADLPDGVRPDPPSQWVRGFTERNWSSRGCPDDPATLHAVYRASADPEAFDTCRPRRFASIDLETAGPAGGDGFEPEAGCIIEVSVVTVDQDGNELSAFTSLVRPEDRASGTYGTGAVDVHGITWDMVADAPRWGQVAPSVAAELDRATMLAQNASFEKRWLAHHCEKVGVGFNPDRPTVDTLDIARTHYADLDNHQLATVCDHVGVAYTDGHRAEHDARVTAEAFLAMRADIHDTYRADERFAGLPAPGVR